MKKHKKIILSHPGHVKVAYETAYALQDSKRYFTFYTSLFFSKTGFFNSLHNFLKRRLGFKFFKYPLMRTMDELLPSNIKLIPFLEFIYLVSVRTPFFKKYSNYLLVYRNKHFDRKISRIIKNEKADVFIGFDTCVARSFLEAKKIGAVCVLHQVIGHFNEGVIKLKKESEMNSLLNDYIESYQGGSPEHFAQSKIELDLADWIFAPSPYVKDSLIKNGVLSSKILLCPYGVNVKQFTPENKKSLKTAFQVLFVGSIGFRKGIKYLVDALNLVKGEGIEVVIIGNSLLTLDPLYKLGINFDFVHIKSVRYSDLHKHYQSADIFVSPSLHEGSSLSIYEALACGLPVITTYESGSVVRDNVDGFIVPAYDSAAIADKIMLLKNNKALKNKMSKNAREQALKFSWATYRQRFINILEDNNII
tara:strand:+ start:4767 stop:6026 length:1260 start_codon:yes stop_codon:yes gene_type:complete